MQHHARTLVVEPAVEALEVDRVIDDVARAVALQRGEAARDPTISARPVRKRARLAREYLAGFRSTARAARDAAATIVCKISGMTSGPLCQRS